MVMNIDANNAQAPRLWETVITGLAFTVIVALLTLGLSLGVAYTSAQSGDDAAAAPASEAGNTRVVAPAPAPGQGVNAAE